MLEKVKLALRIKNDLLDEMLQSDIDAAIIDLKMAGIVILEPYDAIIERAIITYCQLKEGNAEDYDRLKQAYDEQKAQLSMATGYTNYEK